jgi:hypothetical protein
MRLITSKIDTQKVKEKTKQNKNPVITFNIKEGGRSIRAVSHNPIAKA